MVVGSAPGASSLPRYMVQECHTSDGSPTSLAPDWQVLAELASSRGLLVGAYLAAIVVGGALLVFLYRAGGARRWPLRAVWCGAGAFIAAGLALLPSPIAFLLWGIAAVLLEQAEAHTYAAPGGSSHAS